MKKEIAVLAICLIIVGGIFYFGRKDSVSNSQTSTSTPVLNTIKVSPIVSEYASTTYTSVSLNYPKSSEDELSEVFLTVRDIKNDFIKAKKVVEKKIGAKLDFRKSKDIRKFVMFLPPN